MVAFITEQDIEHLVTPKIQAIQKHIVLHKVDLVTMHIQTNLAWIEVQSRDTTQTVSLLDSDGLTGSTRIWQWIPSEIAERRTEGPDV